MKIFLIILAVIVVAIVALLAVAATKPDAFKVSRSIVIQAPPEKIIPLVDDFHRWASWSPYEKLDPAMTRTYGGPASGVGATYGWSSKGKAGVGDMKVTEVTPSKVLIDLNFTKPITANNVAGFTFKPVEGGTEVTWSMVGPNPLIGKVMHTLFDFDKMVGSDFEKGLTDLKKQAES